MKKCKHYDEENGWCKLKTNWAYSMPNMFWCDGTDTNCKDIAYPTIFEKFKAMTIDEFAEWLDKNGQFDDSPWMEWWDEKYCKNCEPIMCHYESTPEREYPVSWCEIEGHCKFFPDMKEAPDNKEIIKMWLEQEE